MYVFNSAAIFLPGHPYIESTTVLSDIVYVKHASIQDGLWGAPPNWSMTLVTHVCPAEYCDCNEQRAEIVDDDIIGCLLQYDDPFRICHPSREGMETHAAIQCYYKLHWFEDHCLVFLRMGPPFLIIRLILCTFIGILCGECKNGSGVGMLSNTCRDLEVPQYYWLVPLYCELNNDHVIMTVEFKVL